MSFVEEDDLSISEDDFLDDYEDCISNAGITYAELTPLEHIVEFENNETSRTMCENYHDSSSMEYIPPLAPISYDSSEFMSSHNNYLILSLLDCKSSLTLFDDIKPIARAGSNAKNVDTYKLCLSSSHSDKIVEWSDLELDTRDVAERVTNELKRLNISQVLFAQKILGRSQGTLSDLLRNPKPWSKMKSGRETFGRMLKWLQESDTERLSVLASPKSCKPQGVQDCTLKKM